MVDKSEVPMMTNQSKNIEHNGTPVCLNENLASELGEQSAIMRNTLN